MGYFYHSEVMNRQQQNQMTNSDEIIQMYPFFLPQLNSGVLFVGFGITDLELEQEKRKGTRGHKLNNFDIRTDNIKL